ncbi:Alpha/Beta hydrolase protein [Scleroderma yunnanense]
MSDLPSATRWGSPAANKRALLIHGLGCSSLTWERVAQALVQAGFFVVAPNLLGHGFRTGTDFRLTTLAEDLQSYLADTDFNVIIGHSVGGAIATILLSSLPKSRPISVILVDPSLKFTPEFIEEKKVEWANSVANVKSIEAFMAEFPTWTRVDATTRVIGLQACTSPDVIREILGQNCPWSFGHLLSEVPDNVTVTALVARTEVLDHIPPHPKTRTVFIPGVSHWVQYEAPERIISAATESAQEL